MFDLSRKWKAFCVLLELHIWKKVLRIEKMPRANIFKRTMSDGIRQIVQKENRQAFITIMTFNFFCFVYAHKGQNDCLFKCHNLPCMILSLGK